MMEMTSRERVLAALKRDETDCVPHCELFTDPSLAGRLLNISIGGGTAGRLKKHPYTAEQAKQLAELLGHDNIGYTLRAQDYVKIGIGKDGRTFPGEGLIKSEADLDMIQLPDNTRDEYYKDAEEFVNNKGDYACHLSTRVGLSQTMTSLGFEPFSMMLYQNRPLVEKILDIYFDWTSIMVERICQMGFDFLWTTDDFAFKTAMFFSPKMFDELLKNRFEKLLEKVTIPWVLHSDGKIEGAIPTLISLGVTGLHPMEKGAMNPVKTKKQFGDSVCLLGNVDLVTLGMGTTAEVEAEVKSLIKDLGPGSGYIITSGNSLASYLIPENVLAMAETIRKYRSYPINIA